MLRGCTVAAAVAQMVERSLSIVQGWVPCISTMGKSSSSLPQKMLGIQCLLLFVINSNWCQNMLLSNKKVENTLSDGSDLFTETWLTKADLLSRILDFKVDHFRALAEIIPKARNHLLYNFLKMKLTLERHIKICWVFMKSY